MIVSIEKVEDILVSLIETENVPAEHANKRKDENIVELVDRINAKIKFYIDHFITKKKNPDVTQHSHSSIKHDLVRLLRSLTVLLENELLFRLLKEITEELGVAVARAAVAGAFGFVAGAVGGGGANPFTGAGVATVAAAGSLVWSFIDQVKDLIDDATWEEQLRALIDHYFWSPTRSSSVYTKEKREKLFGVRPKWGAKTGKLYPGGKSFAKAMASSARRVLKPTKIDKTGDEKMNATNENKILKEYILQNTVEKFEETAFGQMVVDEINKAVGEIPEIKLALEQISTEPDPELEAHVKKLGRGYAEYALNTVRDRMIVELPNMVEEIIKDLLGKLERAR